MTCPKCGSDWVADKGLMGIITKGWGTTHMKTYHEEDPDEPRYECVVCKHKWGKFK